MKREKRDDKNRLKIFIIHGMGNTKKDYAKNFIRALKANDFAFKNQKPVRCENVYNETFTVKTSSGHIQRLPASACTTIYRLEKDNQKLNVYSFYWNNMNSGLTNIQLKGINNINGHDLEKEHVLSKRTVAKIINYGFSDALAYTNTKLKEEIKKATTYGIKKMYDDGDSNSDDQYVFISISLGSQILFDVLNEMFMDKTLNGKLAALLAIGECDFRTMVNKFASADEFYMLANQIPLTSIAEVNIFAKEENGKKFKNDSLTSFLNNLTSLRAKINLDENRTECGRAGRRTSLRAKTNPDENKELKIISFVAPNDLIGYPIPERYGNDNVKIINIRVGNSYKMLFFTIPLNGGHNKYLKNDSVRKFLIKGNCCM